MICTFSSKKQKYFATLVQNLHPFLTTHGKERVLAKIVPYFFENLLLNPGNCKVNHIYQRVIRF